MATTWHIARQEMIDDKWKDRTVSALAKDIEATVCNAALEWEQSRADEGARGKRAKTGGTTEHAGAAAKHADDKGSLGVGDAANGSTSQPSAGTVRELPESGVSEHGGGVGLAKHAGGTVSKLPETPNDVTSLSRLGLDMFEATLRSGAIWRGDTQLLKTLPQGEAKLATLETRELVARAKAKAKAKAAEAPPREEAKDATPAAKRQRTLR